MAQLPRDPQAAQPGAQQNRDCGQSALRAQHRGRNTSACRQLRLAVAAAG